MMVTWCYTIRSTSLRRLPAPKLSVAPREQRKTCLA
jgi:hypothetical protein